MLEPIGFWSYTRQDDELSGGSLGRLRKLLLAELQGRMGRRPVRIFQDVEAIPFGADWQQQIDAGLAASSFFVPIITPGFLQSPGCCYEVTQFRARAAAQGWDGVIFPLYYIDADDLADEPQDDLHDPEVQRFLWQRQMFNFRDLRLRNPDGEEARHRIDTFAEAIYRVLRRDGRSSAPGQDMRNAAGVGVMPPAASQPGSVIRDGDGPEIVLIPPGEFVMGIPEAETQREGIEAKYDDDARPQHAVTIAHAFYMGKYPVTRGEFAEFAKATGFADARWQNPGFAQTDAHPVVNVSHVDAEAYAAWLSRETGKDYRLPSEAEWEYAARAGTVTARYWGDGWDAAGAFAHAGGKTGTAAAGSLRSNSFGLHDMLGNVWEWTADHWHNNYDSAPNDGSAWTTGGDGALRVLRGGSWDYDPRDARAGYRYRGRTGNRGDDVGFRLSRTL